MNDKQIGIIVIGMVFIAAFIGLVILFKTEKISIGEVPTVGEAKKWKKWVREVKEEVQEKRKEIKEELYSCKEYQKTNYIGEVIYCADDTGGQKCNYCMNSKTLARAKCENNLAKYKEEICSGICDKGKCVEAEPTTSISTTV